MAKPNFPDKQTPPQPAWGTWEELLLASAVNRHGTASWDSVAAELRKRATATATATSIFLLLTPLSCKQKFLDLRRRFSKNDADDGGGGPEEKEPLASIPFLDELRRLRVDELRRELQRYDLSIVSLETKVEKLKEEREMSMRGIDDRETKPDLEREEDRNGSVEVSKLGSESPENKAPGEASANGERSENESNSSDLKKESPKAEEKASVRSEPASGEKPPEDSYDGSSDTTAKGSAAVSPVERTEKAEPEKLGGDSAESKGGIGRVEEEDGTKEVCSRESLSRKKKLDSEPDEPDGEDRSVETKRAHINVESQPLIKFLEILRSHNSGSFFERRLPIQETRGYNNIIRQHIDFETIGTCIDEGRYSNSKAKFFRDLMLVLNNAIVFFGRKSPESAAAVELLTLVRSEMKTISQTKQEPPVKEEEEQRQKPSPSPPVSLMRKPKISIPMNACRKRSSIASRTVSANTNITSTSSSEEHQETKKESVTTTTTATSDAPAATKNGRKDRLRGNARNKKNPNTSPSPGPNQDSESKPEKNEKNVAISGAKKRGAASFLNRLKRGSPAKSKEKEETTNTPAPKRRAVASLEESPAKRNVGRPNKRLPAPATKRRRQSAEAEVVVAPRNVKKRLRK